MDKTGLESDHSMETMTPLGSMFISNSQQESIIKVHKELKKQLQCHICHRLAMNNGIFQ
jgi:hypothetical protein